MAPAIPTSAWRRARTTSGLTGGLSEALRPCVYVALQMVDNSGGWAASWWTSPLCRSLRTPILNRARRGRINCRTGLGSNLQDGSGKPDRRSQGRRRRAWRRAGNHEQSRSSARQSVDSRFLRALCCVCARSGGSGHGRIIARRSRTGHGTGGADGQEEGQEGQEGQEAAGGFVGVGRPGRAEARALARESRLGPGRGSSRRADRDRALLHHRVRGSSRLA